MRHSSGIRVILCTRTYIAPTPLSRSVVVEFLVRPAVPLLLLVQKWRTYHLQRCPWQEMMRRCDNVCELVY